MAEEINLTKPEVQPETVVGDNHDSPQCSNILANKMQCPRLASIRKASDTEQKEALCSVCFSLAGHPAEYDTPVRRN